MADADLAIDDRLRFLCLDEAARRRLRALHAKIEEALPSITDDFYEHLGKTPEMAPLLAGEGTIDRLKQAQRAHWSELLSGRLDEGYVGRAMAIGRAHERIGLDPRWYVGAYSFILERLIARLLRGRGRPGERIADVGVLLRAAFLDMDLAICAYIHRRDDSRQQADLLTLADVLDREVEGAIELISVQSEQMNENAQGLSTIAAGMHAAASAVDASVATTLQTTGAVGQVTQRLQTTSQGIAQEADAALRLTDDAVAQAELASRTVRGLSEATAKIDEVVSLVQAIAAQTRLLALNATIEAARAGEAGRGFAVVAGEVKNLAMRTDEAIKTISAQAATIRQTTLATATIVEDVSGKIRGVHAVAERVTGAAGEQQTAARGISGSVAEVTQHAETVAAQTQDLFGQAERTSGAAQRAVRLSQHVSTNISELHRRLTTILRSSGVGDRRREERYPVALRFRAAFDGKTVEGYTGNLNTSGAFLVCSAEFAAGLTGSLDLDGVGRAAVRLCGRSSAGLHVQFLALDAERKARITRIVEESKQGDDGLAAQAQDLARRIEAALEDALRRGRITVPELFSSDYVQLPDTDPAQYSVPFTALADELLPPIIEQPLSGDPRVVFCAAVDRNGYLPTHNRKYSQPQRPGDPLWNAANCRNRRFFDDRTGLLAARNSQPCLVQAYPRDMGGGSFVVLKEFDSPIVVQGKHWGGLRLAVRP